MHELLKEYITKKELEQSKKLAEQKNDLLLSKGLYHKEYSEKNAYSPEYPCSEWDEGTQEHKYFRKVPIEITDSEYEKLKQLCQSGDKEQKHNTVASVLTVLAWVIFIGGFIAGITLGNVEITKGTHYTYTDTEFSFPIALTYWAVSFISGIFVLGFAEIVKLLNEIKNK